MLVSDGDTNSTLLVMYASMIDKQCNLSKCNIMDSCPKLQQTKAKHDISLVTDVKYFSEQVHGS